MDIFDNKSTPLKRIKQFMPTLYIRFILSAVSTFELRLFLDV